MNTCDIYKWVYRVSRRQQHGIVDSFIRAVKAAIRPPAF